MMEIRVGVMTVTSKEKPRLLIILLIVAVIITSGCTTLSEVSEPVSDTMDIIGNSTCTDICSACEKCTAEMKDRGLLIYE